LPDEIVKDRLRMLAAVDRGIGRLRDALEKKGVLNDTIFVVTSDQGFFYGEFGLAQERRLAYEASIRIPLILRYPALAKAGTRPAFLVGNVDIAPTILDLTATAAPGDMDGKSIVSALRGSPAAPRQSLLIEYYSDREFPRLQSLGYQAVRTSRYKYIRYRELSGVDELYDLQEDPYELNNLLPGQAPVALEGTLSRQLDDLVRGGDGKHDSR
jgi:arylsulfatase A-like enzyme